jgi:segregation and condensation protein A
MKEAHIFKLSNFEGPLALLLELIRQNDINIYDIPIARLTDEYLTCLRTAPVVDLDDLTEFYAMAATLLYIKSRMLLPITVDETTGEPNDPRADLVEKLIEYQKFKKLSTLLASQEAAACWTPLHRPAPLPKPRRPPTTPLDARELFAAFSRLTASLCIERVLDLREEISINEKLTLLAELLADADEIPFSALITRKGSMLDVICAFLALLDAVKNQTALVFQSAPSDEIRIRRPPSPV